MPSFARRREQVSSGVVGVRERVNLAGRADVSIGPFMPRAGWGDVLCDDIHAGPVPDGAVLIDAAAPFEKT